MLLVYGLHTRRKFEMALGSETNEPVNHWRAVHQRVGEFWGLLSGSEAKHIRYRSDPIFSVSEQRIRLAGWDRRNPLETAQKAKRPITRVTGRFC